MSKSFADALKTAEYEFLSECAKELNSKQKYVKCTVHKGLSMSYMEYKGTDKSDFDLSGTVQVDMTGAHDCTLTVMYDSAYRGKGDDGLKARTGDLTVDQVVRMVMRNLG